ncbi:MAG: DUF4432 family protein [Christensenellales bacterium]|jgi:hypothetical protein
MDSRYYGHNNQLYGVEQMRLEGSGRGDGMRLLSVRNGGGLDVLFSVDRCVDPSRVTFKGVNYGFFGLAGWTHPAYFDGVNYGKAANGGFMQTCGLENIGIPSVDNGEALSQHGTIGLTPAESISHWIQDDTIIIRAAMNTVGMSMHRMRLLRTIRIPLFGNTISFEDTAENYGENPAPIMILYHINTAYPLLHEDSILKINSVDVKPRTDHAAKDIDTWDKILPPQPGYMEQCYYHFFDPAQKAYAALYNPNIDKGLAITFDQSTLDRILQWKQVGVKNYVMGLEPGNSFLEGRDKEREAGRLKFLAPGETMTFKVNLEFFDGRAAMGEYLD